MPKITVRPYEGSDLKPVLSIWNRALHRDPMTEGRFVRSILADPDFYAPDELGVTESADKSFKLRPRWYPD